MNLALTVLEIVAPVFFLALIGYTWVKLGHDYRIEFVTKLTMTLSIPALIFTALMKTEIEPAALGAISLAAIVGYVVIGLVTWAVLRWRGLEMRTFLAPLIFGNTGNLGLPLALFAFGETGIGYAVVVFAVMAIGSFTFGLWVVSGGGSPMKAAKEPLVWATLLGALFLWQGWHTPRFITNTLELLGQIAIPVMLITLGVAVARLHPHGLGRASLLVLFKVVLNVAVGLGVATIFGLAPIPTAVLTVQLSTPVAVTSYMLAEKYGADSDAVAAMVVTSTLLSVITIPLTLALFV